MYPELSMQEKEITRGIPAFPTNAGMMAIVRRLHVESGGPVPVTLILPLGKMLNTALFW